MEWMRFKKVDKRKHDMEGGINTNEEEDGEESIIMCSSADVVSKVDVVVVEEIINNEKPKIDDNK
jgi:hypothetical protein